MLALRPGERDRLIVAVPQMDGAFGKLQARHQAVVSGEKFVAQISPNQA